jgi:hypothetical protein
MDNGFIKLCRDPRGSILAPEHLPDMSPSGLSFPQLCTDCLDVIVILGPWARSILPRYLNTSTRSKTSPWTENCCRRASADVTAPSRCCFCSTPMEHSFDM